MDQLETATFAAGCFWCTEAIFRRLKGIHSVTSGYTGGIKPNPTYSQVCSGTTGHTEAIQITFDPKQIPYQTLLEIFWRTHDPTTLNRQGADFGTQYRSVVFYHNQDQKHQAKTLKIKLDQQGGFKDKIVTEITRFTTFYVAENYHQNYYQKNASAPYCQVVISPKLTKLLAEHQKLLKPEYHHEQKEG